MIKYSNIFNMVNIILWLVIVLQVYKIIDIGSLGIKIVLLLTICNSFFLFFINKEVTKQRNNF